MCVFFFLGVKWMGGWVDGEWQEVEFTQRSAAAAGTNSSIKHTNHPILKRNKTPTSLNALAPPAPPAGPSSFTSTTATLIPAKPSSGLPPPLPSSRVKRLGTGGAMVCPSAAAMAWPSRLEPVASRTQAQGRRKGGWAPDEDEEEEEGEEVSMATARRPWSLSLSGVMALWRRRRRPSND